MTFATNNMGNLVFGLPGNPVSAFVTFHLFVLPSLRKYCGYEESQWSLARIPVQVIEKLTTILFYFSKKIKILTYFAVAE